MSSQKVSNHLHIVLGLGQSGINAAQLLKSAGKRVIILENNSNERLKKISHKLKLDGIEVVLLGEPLDINNFTPWIEETSSIIVSPGIDWEHITLKELRNKNIILKGESSLAWEQLNHLSSIGITGTNGKTTVTNMINHILKSNNYKAEMGGNIGKALSEIALKNMKGKQRKLDWLIMELSSYQIENSPNINPTIGIWTTFTPDHLERHKNLENYFRIKKSLLERSSIRIYNSDDQYLFKKRKELPEGIWVGIKQQSSYAYNPKFWIDKKGYIFEDQKKLFHKSILKIPGEHNLQNLLLATAATREIGVDYHSIANSINTFEPIPHRLEYLGKANNVIFYNDSKATNFDSSVTGLRSVESPSILIAGGIQKKGDPTLWLKQLMQSTNGIVLFGVSAKDINQTIEDSCYEGRVIIKETLEEATKAAIKIAKATKSKSIILSPACASFDQYENYEDRGNHFKNLVKELGIFQ